MVCGYFGDKRNEITTSSPYLPPVPPAASKTSRTVRILRIVVLVQTMILICYGCFFLGYYTVPPGYVYVDSGRYLWGERQDRSSYFCSFCITARLVPQEIEEDCASRLTMAGCINSAHCGYCVAGEQGICTAGDTFGPWSSHVCCESWEHHTRLTSDQCINLHIH